MTILPGDDPEFRDFAKTKAAPRGRSCLLQAFLATAVLGVLVGLMLPATRTAGGAAKRAQCQNNLRNIMLALRSYAEDHGALPPAYTVDADGRPLHSWRTLILPYLDQEDLYRTIDLSKPWNDPANAQAFETSIPIYRCHSVSDEPSNKTIYRASAGPHAYLRLTEPRPTATITDGEASTLAVIEVEGRNAVPWMTPEDADEAMILGLDSGPSLQHPGGVNAGYADGSIRFLGTYVTPQVRRVLISVDGGETVSLDQYL